MDDALLSVMAPRWFLQLGSRSHEVHVGVLFGHRKDPWKWSNENLDVVVIYGCLSIHANFNVVVS